MEDKSELRPQLSGNSRQLNLKKLHNVLENSKNPQELENILDSMCEKHKVALHELANK